MFFRFMHDDGAGGIACNRHDGAAHVDNTVNAGHDGNTFYKLAHLRHVVHRQDAGHKPGEEGTKPNIPIGGTPCSPTGNTTFPLWEHDVHLEGMST